MAIPWLFGARWTQAVLPTQILALGGAATLVTDCAGAVLMARGRVLMPEHFPARTEGFGDHNSRPLEIDLLSMPFHKAVGRLEKHLIEKAIEESGGNKSEAANRLQINRRLLYNKMAEHKIED